MEIKLYITEDSDTVMNKDLTLITTLDIQMRDTQNVSAPILILGEIAGVDLKAVNYAYIDEFKRYYFIRTITVGQNNIHTLAMECDVIETYKEDILNSSAQINRGVKKGDYGDIGTSTEVRREVDIFKSDKGFVGKNSIILSTIGTEVTV